MLNNKATPGRMYTPMISLFKNGTPFRQWWVFCTMGSHVFSLLREIFKGRALSSTMVGIGGQQRKSLRSCWKFVDLREQM